MEHEDPVAPLEERLGSRKRARDAVEARGCHLGAGRVRRVGVCFSCVGVRGRVGPQRNRGQSLLTLPTFRARFLRAAVPFEDANAGGCAGARSRVLR